MTSDGTTDHLQRYHEKTKESRKRCKKCRDGSQELEEHHYTDLKVSGGSGEMKKQEKERN
jgi:hypothetical protein